MNAIMELEFPLMEGQYLHRLTSDHAVMKVNLAQEVCGYGHPSFKF